MTEIRKEVASILRKLRNLGYENYELVRTSKEVQCVDLDGYPFHAYGQIGENIPVEDVLGLVEQYKQMYPDNKNGLYFEVGEDEGIMVKLALSFISQPIKRLVTKSITSSLKVFIQNTWKNKIFRSYSGKLKRYLVEVLRHTSLSR